MGKSEKRKNQLTGKRRRTGNANGYWRSHVRPTATLDSMVSIMSFPCVLYAEGMMNFLLKKKESQDPN